MFLCIPVLKVMPLRQGHAKRQCSDSRTKTIEPAATFSHISMGGATSDLGAPCMVGGNIAFLARVGPGATGLQAGRQVFAIPDS